MHLTLRILMSAIVPALFLPGAATASILAIAQGAATGPFTGPTYIDAFGANAATARITATPVAGGSFANTAFSSTVFGDLMCLFCGQSMDARVTGDGTGTVKLFSGVGMTENTRGIAFARLELEDTINVGASPLSLSMDAFFGQFQRGPLTLFPSGTHANFQMGLTLIRVGDPSNSYSFTIDAVTSYQVVPAVNVEHWQIQETVGAGSPTTIASGASLATLNGHLGFSQQLALNSGAWALSFYANTESFCQGGLPGNCVAAFNSWNTSYLGIQGGFTSQNGYTYTGLASAPVPEPGTFYLLLPFAGGILLLRGKVRTKRT